MDASPGLVVFFADFFGAVGSAVFSKDREVLEALFALGGADSFGSDDPDFFIFELFLVVLCCGGFEVSLVEDSEVVLLRFLVGSAVEGLTGSLNRMRNG